MADFEFYKKIVDNLNDGLYFVNTDRVITYWNKGAELISGFTAEEVIGKSCSDDILTHVNIDGKNLCTSACPLAGCMKDLKFMEVELFMHHKDGHRIPVSVRANPMIDSSGEVVGAFELFTDISNKKANELKVKELEKLSFLDYLTKLSNRAFTSTELESRIEEYQRYKISFGVLFIDIDHFKNFNDTYGHEVGDKVLEFVANTFSANCRPFDLYGRWGGEEFLGIIRNVDIKGLETHGNIIRQLIENSYLLNGNDRLSVTISLGGTIVCSTDDAKSIVARADKLLYKSKATGRNKLTMG